ncbi:MAG: DUF2262 domain-containing protein [Prevotella sp.]|jgi:hypothetical protein|nr:DUF2262 domain-containing protein [Prevotella sp.]
MNGWEIKSFTQALNDAQSENSKELDSLVANYPLCAVKSDYSQAIILRRFHVQIWKDERRVLNCEPDTYAGSKSNDEQWGITLANYDKTTGSGSEGSKCIPNYKYTSVSINDDTITLKWENSEVATNLKEIYRKLRFIYGISTTKEIEEAFGTLCNETIIAPPPVTVVYKTLESEILGTFKFDKKLEYYRTKVKIGKRNVNITIDLTYPEELKKNLKKAEKLMSGKFYEKALLKMAKPMVKLKNDTWLEEYDNGEEEQPITAEELLKRVRITDIAFDDECEAEIYCDDDDIFWGHSILISTNARGTYQDATLAG